MDSKFVKSVVRALDEAGELKVNGIAKEFHDLILDDADGLSFETWTDDSHRLSILFYYCGRQVDRATITDLDGFLLSLFEVGTEIGWDRGMDAASRVEEAMAVGGS